MKRYTLTGLLALCLAVPALFAAEPLPYGHKDFVPTPERPVYFRQTYGDYPGAKYIFFIFFNKPYIPDIICI